MKDLCDVPGPVVITVLPSRPAHQSEVLETAVKTHTPKEQSNSVPSARVATESDCQSSDATAQPITQSPRHSTDERSAFYSPSRQGGRPIRIKLMSEDQRLFFPLDLYFDHFPSTAALLSKLRSKILLHGDFAYHKSEKVWFWRTPLVTGEFMYEEIYFMVREQDRERYEILEEMKVSLVSRAPIILMLIVEVQVNVDNAFGKAIPEYFKIEVAKVSWPNHFRVENLQLLTPNLSSTVDDDSELTHASEPVGLIKSRTPEVPQGAAKADPYTLETPVTKAKVIGDEHYSDIETQVTPASVKKHHFEDLYEVTKEPFAGVTEFCVNNDSAQDAAAAGPDQGECHVINDHRLETARSVALIDGTESCVDNPALSRVTSQLDPNHVVRKSGCYGAKVLEDESATTSAPYVKLRPPPDPCITRVRVTTPTYFDQLAADATNTTASTRLLRVIEDEGVSLDSSLGLKLLDLVKALRAGGELGPVEVKDNDIKSKGLEPITARLDEFAGMLNAIAESVGVDLLDNDDDVAQNHNVKGSGDKKDQAETALACLKNGENQIVEAMRDLSTVPTSPDEARPEPAVSNLATILQSAQLLNAQSEGDGPVSGTGVNNSNDTRTNERSGSGRPSYHPISPRQPGISDMPGMNGACAMPTSSAPGLSSMSTGYTGYLPPRPFNRPHWTTHHGHSCFCHHCRMVAYPTGYQWTPYPPVYPTKGFDRGYHHDTPPPPPPPPPPPTAPAARWTPHRGRHPGYSDWSQAEFGNHTSLYRPAMGW